MQELQHRLATSYPIYRKIWQTLKEDISHPFSIAAYHTFLGYPSKEACREAIEQALEADMRKEELLVANGNEPDLLLGKQFFLDLARKRKNADPWLKDLSTWFEADLLQKKILRFDDATKKRKLSWLGLKVKAKGSFYTYSLDTYQLAASLSLSPQAVFDSLNTKGLLSFAAQLDFKEENIWLETEQENSSIFIPYASFNSLDPHVRKRFFPCLQHIYDEFPLDDQQLQLMEIIAESVEKMLNLQAEYDQIRKEEAQKNEERIARKKHKRLRIHYKHAAQLCHPDKHEEAEQKNLAHRLFLELSAAYEEKQLSEVQQIHLQAVQALGNQADLKSYQELIKV